MRHLKAVLIVSLTALISAPIALAQQPTSGSGEGGGVQGAVGGGMAGSGSLPFTGLDLIVFVVGGLVLLALGLLLRATTRSSS
jgi:hypothetical protein